MPADATRLCIRGDGRTRIYRLNCDLSKRLLDGEISTSPRIHHGLHAAAPAE